MKIISYLVAAIWTVFVAANKIKSNDANKIKEGINGQHGYAKLKFIL